MFRPAWATATAWHLLGGACRFGALQHSGLTARQLEVARLLAQGCPNKAIAGMLDNVGKHGESPHCSHFSRLRRHQPHRSRAGHPAAGADVLAHREIVARPAQPPAALEYPQPDTGDCVAARPACRIRIGGLLHHANPRHAPKTRCMHAPPMQPATWPTPCRYSLVSGDTARVHDIAAGRSHETAACPLPASPMPTAA